MKHQFKTLLLVSLLLVAGCNDTPLVEEESTNTQRTFTLSASMPGSGDHATRVAGEQDPASLDIVLKWEVGDKIQLYFDDGSNITPGGEVVVYDISSDEKTAQFDVVVPISGPFDLYGVHGTTSETNGSAILLDVAPDNFVKLEDARVPLYFIKKDFDLNSPDQTVDFEHLGALQVITFKNTSDGEITLGSPSLSFSGTDKWYYDYDGNNVPVFDIVQQPPGTVTTKSGTFTPEQFTPVNISPNDNIMLAQWIMPNGNTPPEINFTAEIGGAPKDTPDPKGSRSSALQIGKAYHLYVLWDGTNLSFAEEVYKITMTTSSSDQLQLLIDAEPGDRNDVWIDLNNNGVRDSNENNITFGDSVIYNNTTQTITIYGKVTSLYCYKKSLTELDVSKNPALTVLDCSQNSLTTLDVTKNPALTELDCSQNSLEILDVSKNPTLSLLTCYENYLQVLDVSKNPLITKLDCSVNYLTALDVTNNTVLQELLCYMNEINGNAMGNLIVSLPDRSGDEEGLFYVIDIDDLYEGNVCTAGQVDSANAKNWNVLDSEGDPYP